MAKKSQRGSSTQRKRASRTIASTAPAAGTIPRWRWFATQPALIAVLFTLGVIATLGPNGLGPGLTPDEYYDVFAGKRIITWLASSPSAWFDATSIDETFDPLTRHPPLGRVTLGLVHRMFDGAPENPAHVSVAVARFAPAVAYGVLIFLVGVAAGRIYGPPFGGAASFLAACVPRLFGHAHFATLDTFTAFSWFAALFAMQCAYERDFARRRLLIAGFMWGLALLTKIHGVLLAPPIVVWLFWAQGRRAFRSSAIWAGTGLVTFFAGWPWLWRDPVGRFFEFIGTATDRVVLHTFYLGQVYADVDVPWHYPLTMWAAAVPCGVMAFFVLGVAQPAAMQREPRVALYAGAWVMLIFVFSVPSVPVYDGIRLFLPVVPLGSLIAAGGVKRALAILAATRLKLVAAPVVTAIVLLQGCGLWLYYPAHTSHYSALVGGLWGAEHLGFEVNYWGDSVSDDALQSAVQVIRSAEPRGSDRPIPIVFAPDLTSYHTRAIAATYPALAADDIGMVRFDEPAAASSRYAIVFNRRAEWPQTGSLVDGGKVEYESSLQGVWLVRLYGLTNLGDGDRAQSDDGQ